MRALLAALLLTLAAPHGEAVAAKRCRAPTGAKVLLREPAVTLHVRTIEPGPANDGVTYVTACRPGARKRVLLARATDDGVGGRSMVGAFTVAGPYVAYVYAFTNHYGDGATEVVVKRWRDAAQVRAVGIGQRTGFCGPGYDADHWVRELRLARNGRIAFLVDRLPCFDAQRHAEVRGTSGGLLGSGPLGSLTRLRVNRTHATWLHDGQPRSAPLG